VLDRADARRAGLVGQHRAQARVAHVAEIGLQHARIAGDVAPAEDDAVVGRGRQEQHLDLATGMQADAGAGDGPLQGPLRDRLRFGATFAEQDVELRAGDRPGWPTTAAADGIFPKNA
jgi:hypothetical protein